MSSGIPIKDGIAAFVLAFMVTAALLPRAIRALQGFGAGQIVSRDGPESHLAKEGTPTMGGLALLVGLMFASVTLGLIHEAEGVVYGFVFGGSGLIAALALIAGYGLLGFLDDYLIVSRGKALGLKARHKLLGQFLLAAGFMVYFGRTGGETYVHLPAAGRVELGNYYYVLAAFFIVGMSNAVNLTDGLDGLVAGLSVAVAGSFGVLLTLFIVGVGAPIDPALVIICAAMAGASLAFLWFNAHPARIFMGDTGSLALGAGLAAAAIMAKQEFALLVFGLVFVVEALSVIIQVISFKTTGKRVFKMSPIHHHFELCGWPEQKIVVRFWIAGLLCCALGSALSISMMRVF